MKSKIIASAVLLLTIVIFRVAHAAPLNLQLSPTPNIMSGFIDVVYNAATDEFSASGYALEINVGSGVSIVGGLFDISATIDDLGVASSGLLAIDGTVPSLGLNSGSLLIGSLVSFGASSNPGTALEFLFSATGGDALGLYGGAGASLGVILGGANYPGNFSSNFDNLSFGMSGTGSATSDTGVPMAPTPEPASFILLLAGTAILFSLRRRA